MSIPEQKEFHILLEGPLEIALGVDPWVSSRANLLENMCSKVRDFLIFDIDYSLRNPLHLWCSGDGWHSAVAAKLCADDDDWQWEYRPRLHVYEPRHVHVQNRVRDVFDDFLSTEKYDNYLDALPVEELLIEKI